MQTLQLKIACLLFRLSAMLDSLALRCCEAARKIAIGTLPKHTWEDGNDGTNLGGESA